DGCLKDIGPGDPDIYRNRLENELKIIRSMGFAGYFLIVWDFIQYAKSNNIPVGPGRGSAAGSLVAFTLGITEIDPIPYGLLFERFLNPARISMPDIDVDFCMDHRDRVIDYVTEKYGSDHVTQIITFGTMAARGAIRDVGRVLDIPYAEVDKVAKLVHNVPHITLEEAIQSEPKLKELIETDTRIKELVDIAKSLEGLTRHASTHAAGVVISQSPLTEHLPLYKGQGDEVTSQYDMKAIEKIGLVKFDFLGLKTLTVIDMAERLIRARQEGQHDFSIKNVSLEDPKTYELLSSGNTFGIFQLESPGMKELLIKMRPKSFEDLIALVALYRPGPLGSGMADDYIKRRKGLIPIRYEVPQLENILRETHGVILYQEQVIEIANILAGFSLGEADILRLAMGKKKPDEMEKQKNLFIHGAKSKGISEKKAEKIFDLMAYFAGYGFNKSHSAAYAMIAYRTAYLKSHYPLEFMASLLTCEIDNTDKIARYIGESKEMGIGILPPDINRSYKEFTVESGNIRFGLSAIKNVGTAALDSIITSRENEGEFMSIFDFCKRVDLRKVNRKVLEVLIKAGAFDSFGARRSQLMQVLDIATEWADSCKKEIAHGQVSIFESVKSSEDSPYHNLPEIPEWNKNQILAFEKEALGLYITGHPLASYETELNSLTVSTSRISDLADRQEVTVGGTVSRMRRLTTRKGERMASLTLEDLQGNVEILVFPDLFKKYSEDLSNDSPLIITGEIDKAENGVKIKAKKIETLSRLSKREKNNRRVEVRLPSNGLKEDDLTLLKGILLDFPGDHPVFIRIQTNNKESLIAVGNIKIDPSDSFITEIEKRLKGKVFVI
ncbi:MAG: DNA polymerase III subunit alpha, partial [Nitrospirota bacterium]